MRKTVEPAPPAGPITAPADGIVRVLDRELVPVIRALRAAANYKSTERLSVTTDGAGTYSRLWTSAELATDCTVSVLASVAGTATASGSQHAGYLLAATFQSVASVVTQTGATSVLYSHESAAGIDCRFGVADRQAYLEACDAGAAAMTFVAVVEATEAP